MTAKEFLQTISKDLEKFSDLEKEKQLFIAKYDLNFIENLDESLFADDKFIAGTQYMLAFVSENVPIERAFFFASIGVILLFRWKQLNEDIITQKEIAI